MDKNFTKAVILGFSFFTFGFILLHYGLFSYGISFFVLLPFTLGYLLGNSTIKRLSLFGLAFSCLIFCFLIVLGGWEGIICIMMAIPLLAFSIGLGYIVRAIYQKIKDSNSKKINNKDILDEDILKNSLLPLCILLIMGITEKQLTKNDVDIVRVESTIDLPFSPLEVYETIKSVDTLDVEKPFLMKLDLPIPLKCILEEEKIGGRRVCYFKEGQIVEEITALEKGKLLKMDVVDYQLTGRTWLNFDEAIYEFEDLGSRGCKMKRITTYTSHLHPRAYWRPLEKIGIEQEHEYVFNNLKQDLGMK